MRGRIAKPGRGRRETAGHLSLFPFMAVLLCAMGAIIVLLVLFLRQARAQAIQEAKAKVSAAQQDLNAAREMTQWRVSQLAEARQAVQKELTDARLKLGNIENHARELGEQIVQLESARKDLAQTKTQSGRKEEEFQAERARLDREITEAKRRLEETEREAQNRPRSYAVVPYQGPSGTRRRPIYLECRADAIILQPEGIPLVESDLDPPLDAGNPLEQAVRTVRESWLKQGQIQGDGTDEPYPLLLVRPDGIAAYYAARSALKTWKGEVGYELIGDDWKLAFARPNAALAESIHQAVELSRAEQQQKRAILALAMAGQSGPGYRAVPGGGVMREGGPGGDSDGPRRGPGAGASGGFTSAGTGGSSSARSGGSSSAGSGAAKYRLAPGGGLVREEEAGASPSAGARIQNPAPRFGSPYPATGTSVTGASATGASATGASATGEAGSRSMQSPQSGSKAGLPAPRSAASREPTPPGASGQPVRPGEWVPQDFSRPRTSTPDDMEKDSRSAKDKTREKEKEKAKSLAETRGKNWGLPDAARGAVGVTRPIRIHCHPDRLEFMPESGDIPTQVITLGVRTEDFVDALVSAVWDHMRGWGIAGRGMYWRPILRMTVAPDAEERFEELKALLEGSGLDVKRNDER